MAERGIKVKIFTSSLFLFKVWKQEGNFPDPLSILPTVAFFFSCYEYVRTSILTWPTSAQMPCCSLLLLLLRTKTSSGSWAEDYPEGKKDLAPAFALPSE